MINVKEVLRRRKKEQEQEQEKAKQEQKPKQEVPLFSVNSLPEPTWFSCSG